MPLVIRAGDLTVGHGNASPTTTAANTGLISQVFANGIPITADGDWLANHGVKPNHTPITVVTNISRVYINNREVWKSGDQTLCGDTAAVPITNKPVFAGGF